VIFPNFRDSGKRLGLEILHLPGKNNNHLRQFKKKITRGSKKNKLFYCHKLLARLTATSEVGARPLRSRNALGHFTRATFIWKFTRKMPRPREST
jgi:hypothetical protein